MACPLEISGASRPRRRSPSEQPSRDKAAGAGPAAQSRDKAQLRWGRDWRRGVGASRRAGRGGGQRPGVAGRGGGRRGLAGRGFAALGVAARGD